MRLNIIDRPENEILKEGARTLGDLFAVVDNTEKHKAEAFSKKAVYMPLWEFEESLNRFRRNAIFFGFSLGVLCASALLTAIMLLERQ